MPAGELTTYFVPRIAAAKGLSTLTATSDPTITQMVAWLNASIRAIVGGLIPRWMNNGVWTPGRPDKLTQLIAAEAKTGGTANYGLGEIALPTTGTALHYLVIALGKSGTGAVAAMPAVQRSLEELMFRVNNYTPTDIPIYAFADRTLKYLPSTHNIASYVYIKEPSAMVESSAETFPLDADFKPLAVQYILGEMFGRTGTANAPEAELGKMFKELFKRRLKAYTEG
jgi:hypothetical protein